uniref:Uncharacterized protein n=1 Tax=Arundo donax TaxID=35708 RepID=A0A0A9A4J5_ARUDO
MLQCRRGQIQPRSRPPLCPCHLVSLLRGRGLLLLHCRRIQQMTCCCCLALLLSHGGSSLLGTDPGDWVGVGSRRTWGSPVSPC